MNTIGISLVIIVFLDGKRGEYTWAVCLKKTLDMVRVL